jgi:hypothetical protein
MNPRELSAKSGVSVDTIKRIIRKESAEEARIDTVTDIVEKGFGMELWEIFYNGDKSLVSLNAEVAALKEERDSLISEIAVQAEEIKRLTVQVETLKDELLALMREIIKERVNAKV